MKKLSIKILSIIILISFATLCLPQEALCKHHKHRTSTSRLRKKLRTKKSKPKLQTDVLKGEVKKEVEKEVEKENQVEFNPFSSDNQNTANILSPDNFQKTNVWQNEDENYSNTVLEDTAIENIKTVKFTKTQPQTDKFAEDKINIPPEGLHKQEYKRQLVQDTPVIMSKENQTKQKSDYKSEIITEVGIPVIIRPIKKHKTQQTSLKVKRKEKTEKYKVAYPFIGQSVGFKVVENVISDKQIIIKKGSIVEGKIAEVSLRAMGGAPAEMTIEDFSVKSIDGKTIPLNGQVSASGYSLSVWIGLAELATTPFLFGLAVPALRVLPGGQAVVSPRKTYTIYLIPKN